MHLYLFFMYGIVIVTITFPSISSYILVVHSVNAAVLPAQIQPTCMYT